MKSNNNNIIKLFSTFFNIGLFTFGGGYAMISLMEREVVEKHSWISKEDMSDMIVISESTPGPISVNIATFVGFKVAGFLGAFCSTLGLVLPSFLIIILLSSILDILQDNIIFQNAFFGIRAAVVALILKTFVSMYKEFPKKAFTYFILGLTFISVLFLNIKAIYMIILAAIMGLIYNLLISRKEKE